MKTNYFRTPLRKFFRRDSLVRRAIGALVVLSFTLNVLANPTGMTVQSGRASATTSGSQLTVTTGSPLAVLNWQSFNIAAGESTVFNQPSASSVVINRINNNQGVSQIYGSLQGNGVVVLLNSSGFYFGPNSFISAAGLVVSTANCIPPQNAGGSWVFNGPPPLASIVNYGSIKVGQNGSAYLIADQVENHGTIEAPGGSIGLAAGQTVTLSERPDGRGLSMQVTLPQGSVDNCGNLVADGGTIALNANVVNQNGLIQANSVREQNGTIELVAGDSLNLGADSKISAHGDSSAVGSAGGNVTLQSGNYFSDAAGSTISTAGGATGGNGGNIEVSAPNIQSLNSAMDASAQVGWTGGEFLLDPVNIVLGTSGSSTVPNNGTVAYNSGSGTLTLNVKTAFANKNFSSILLQASGTITVDNSTVWNLSTSTGKTTGQLTLEAGTDIVFNSGAKIFDGNNWSVTLDAGYNFTKNSITVGTGNIYLNGGSALSNNGNGAIQLAQGSLNMLAGNSIQVGKGYAITTAGGSIYAHAFSGSINTGSDAVGYYFLAPNDSLLTGESAGTMYDLRDGLGGISTVAGGNVTLVAGGNISSVLPTSGGQYYYNGTTKTFSSGASGNSAYDYTTGGAGAYGPEAGNVTLIAGGNVTGNYLVANGIGSIYAGVMMNNGSPVTDGSGNYVLNTTGSAGTDSYQHALALNLISGGWKVTAAQNIFLQEVRNPNGVFNINGGSGFKHYFDYAPGDYVNLTAGNAVQLGTDSSTVPRLDSFNNSIIPYIYPSQLNLHAGTGGVVLNGDASLYQLILFPSLLGSLTINTSGSLVSALPTVQNVPQIFQLIVSDSSKSQYMTAGDFGLNDHAATPIHSGSEMPVQLNIGGDMDLVMLASSEAAQINVGGNMNNCRFQGMNLSGSDVSSITVSGDINNRSSFTSVDLTALSQQSGWQAPDLSVLSQALSSSPSAATLATSFYYNPTTHVLTYQDIPGQNLADVLNLLQNLTIQVYKNGMPQWVDPQQTIPLTQTVSVINAATAQAMLNEYATLGGVAPSGSYGYTIGGGGQFNLAARNMDLGSTAGIQSMGAGLYNIGNSYPLAELFNHGPAINVNLSGNLDMLSTSIASLNGGDVSINAGGAINAGSPQFTVNTFSPRGIYSTSGGNVSVIGGGDINVNGSRVGTYDGGNVTVESLLGNVNAGNGSSTPVSVSGYYVDPGTHQVYQNSPQLPFSGIVALTFPPRDATYPAPVVQIGDILIEAPNGEVNASSSGILQLALNGQGYPNSFVTVAAGYLLHGSLDQAVTAGQAGLPIVQGTLAAGGSSPHTVLVGSQSIVVSPALWNQLINLLGVNPAPGQAIQMNIGSSHQADLVAALTSNPAGLADFNFATLVSPNRDINANGSGIIASNAKLVASGGINGLIFADHNIDITAVNTVSVNALGGGQVSASSSSGNITGTIIGGTGVSVSGAEVSAALISDNVSGATSGQSGLGTGGAANATANAASASADASADKTTAATADDDSLNKKKGISLAQKVSRVTVILPAAKKVSEVDTKQPKI
jgi:filamentous hemagglutinin family protein